MHRGAWHKARLLQARRVHSFLVVSGHSFGHTAHIQTTTTVDIEGRHDRFFGQG